MCGRPDPFDPYIVKVYYSPHTDKFLLYDTENNYLMIFVEAPPLDFDILKKVTTFNIGDSTYEYYINPNTDAEGDLKAYIYHPAKKAFYAYDPSEDYDYSQLDEEFYWQPLVEVNINCDSYDCEDCKFTDKCEQYNY